MSFPAAFGSQLTAIMEALLKAVVAEVTALVEDGAVELRLELRDRDRQILEKEREIEERGRVIEELRAAVEELTAQQEAAVTPAEDLQEQTENQQQEWTKEEDDDKPLVKSEPTEESAAASRDPHVSLWAPAALSATAAAADSAASCSFDAEHEPSQSYSQYSEDFSQMDPDDLPVDTFLNRNQEQFFSTQQPGFSHMPNLYQVQDTIHNKSTKKKSGNGKRLNFGKFRCNQCSKTFTAKCRLITHQSVHTGAKPYSCEKCGKWFSRTDSLARHKKADACGKDNVGRFKGMFLQQPGTL